MSSWLQVIASPPSGEYWKWNPSLLNATFMLRNWDPPWVSPDSAPQALVGELAVAVRPLVEEHRARRPQAVDERALVRLGDEARLVAGQRARRLQRGDARGRGGRERRQQARDGEQRGGDDARSRPGVAGRE